MQEMIEKAESELQQAIIMRQQLVGQKELFLKEVDANISRLNDRITYLTGRRDAASEMVEQAEKETKQ